ncbi:hypothetical protein [Patulibacter medicamentivorans]|uniref:hypothetical protein n=1 Tax=Patulibacter medicamentivorans TaxID=1097667 RepID=UPI00058E6A00|nr:hypothetical protein [Patulibacter medicamentivorans]
MPHRFAVLWEPLGSGSRPVGIALEREGHVEVDVPDEYCIPQIYREPFVVGGPDMTVVKYKPSDAQYFDHVLLDLSRTFAIEEQGSVPTQQRNAMMDLLHHKVLSRWRANHQEHYRQHLRGFKTVKDRHRRYAAAAEAVHAAEPATADRSRTRVAA